MKKWAFIALLFLGLWPAAAFSQNNGVMPPDFDPNKPIHIQADRLEADNGSQVIRFEGNVVGVQDKSVLNCDILLIHYQPAAKKETSNEPGEPLGGLPEAGGQVRRLIALGRVQLVQEDRRATCDRAEFDNEAQTIALSGNPLVTQGSNALRGSTIVIHLPSRQIEILGASTGRVTVTINPGEAKKLQDKHQGSDQKEQER